MRSAKIAVFSAVTAFTMIAPVAGAQKVEFIGSAVGCFYTGTTPTSCSSGTSSVGDANGSVSYLGSTFDVFSNTADGKLTIGDAPNSPNTNNLGSFALTGGNNNFNQKFALFLTFTQPTGATGDDVYKARLDGNLTGDTFGAVDVNFNNAFNDFTFADGTTLKFKIQDLSLNNSNNGNGGTATVAVTGTGVVATPEPSSMALLGTGLIGLVPMIRRKKQS